MEIVIPKRVFLDTWVLKDLARGKYSSALRILRNMIERSELRLVVTWDHVADFCAANDSASAESEAAFVDTLRPLWMPPGVAIYHREAYSEYLTLTGSPPLSPPSPCSGPMGAMRQWFQDCSCVPEMRDISERDVNFDTGVSFQREVAATYQITRLPGAITQQDTRNMYALLNANRDWGRARESRVSWDKHFQILLEKHLCENPACLERAKVAPLIPKAKIERMHAWCAKFGVEKRWYKSRAKTNLSDPVDSIHLALLPYTDVFVTEKHLASLIHQAHLLPPEFARVFNDPDKWASILRQETH